MTVSEIAAKVNGKILAPGSDGAEITGIYAGDFLSRVMGNAPADSCWLTIMSNINVAGVATLAEIRAIVICEGVKADKLLIEKCLGEGIGLIESDMTLYSACKAL